MGQEPDQVMTAVSLDSGRYKVDGRSEELHYIWTGGRKCNFKGCDRKDLQPAIQNGW